MSRRTVLAAAPAMLLLASGLASMPSNNLVLGSGAAAVRSGGEIERLQTSKKIIALTFDGGDNAGGAQRILATLGRRHVTATFFITGRWARRYPRLARVIGVHYAVGNHTYSHAPLPALTSAAVRAEIIAGARWIRRETLREPRPLFRFPFGDRDSRTIGIVHALGYQSVRWSLDTWGWMGPSAGQSTATVVRRVSTRLRPGDILLMHLGSARDGSVLDAEALPAVIDTIERRDYHFVTLDRFVHAPR
jgi:peptidoglycan/xylan/chitin deacetylase (PgdA/CDA1 family)